MLLFWPARSELPVYYGSFPSVSHVWLFLPRIRGWAGLLSRSTSSVGLLVALTGRKSADALRPAPFARARIAVLIVQGVCCVETGGAAAVKVRNRFYWTLALGAVASLVPVDARAQTLTPEVPAFVVNLTTLGDQLRPDVAMSASGRVCVVFESDRPAVDDADEGDPVLGRCIESDGEFVGPEFQLNESIAGAQTRARATLNAGGDSLCAIWTSDGQDGDREGVYAECFDYDGERWLDLSAGDARVNVTAVGSQIDGDLVALPSASNELATNLAYVYSTPSNRDMVAADIAAVIDAPASTRWLTVRDGAARTAGADEIAVNQYTPLFQQAPRICSDADGDFVVVWSSDGADGDGRGVVGRRFSRSGVASGDEFQVNSYTTGDQDYPVVCCRDDGRFVIAWDSGPDSQDFSGYGVFARRFLANGSAVDEEFRVPSSGIHSQVGPDIACDDAGRFVISWLVPAPDAARGVFVRAFDSNAKPLVKNEKVSSDVFPVRGTQSVGMDQAGNLMVTWTSTDDDGAGLSIAGRRYSLSAATTSTTTSTTTQSTTTTSSTTTKSSTTTTVTTTTTFPPRDCGDPVLLIGERPPLQNAVTASDALAVLRVSVGIGSCALCVCDVDSSGKITATDALTVLTATVSPEFPLNCPACP